MAPAPVQKDQLAAMFDEDTAVVTLYLYLGWRAMHSQGRGLNSVMLNQLGPDMDVYDRVQRGDLMQMAAIVASFVYNAANRDELLPRKPMPRPQPPAATPIK